MTANLIKNWYGLPKQKSEPQKNPRCACLGCKTKGAARITQAYLPGGYKKATKVVQFECKRCNTIKFAKLPEVK